MNFLHSIFENLRQSPAKTILQEVREGRLVPTSCSELLENIERARRRLKLQGLKKGERCALIGPNSRRWVALDLAIMAEGGIAVPLYARQTPEELVAMMQDCCPCLICCADEKLRESVIARWSKAPPTLLFDEIFSGTSRDSGLGLPQTHEKSDHSKPPHRAFGHPLPGWGRGSDQQFSPLAPFGGDGSGVRGNSTDEERFKESGEGDEVPSSDGVAHFPVGLKGESPVTIIYTSGTSGEAKGVVLNVGNITFMLQRTGQRLKELMQNVPKQGDDQVFHYLPFCFAGSWILLLTCLFRKNCLTMSTDLSKLAEEMKVATPHYFLNVPAVLERIRNGILAQLHQTGGLGLALFVWGQAAWSRRRNADERFLDGIWLAMARTWVFSKIRNRLSPYLRALICGSAPLAEETQLFFQMMGIRVLQVYGLTETTAICTMDDVREVTPGRVGPAISGIEMKLGDSNEILVRGPNIFPGYWNRLQATAEVMRDGWLHTGDQGEVDERGNWKIVGRLKNLIITSGGHNVSPEPIEQMLLSALPETDQVMVIGNGRKFLSVLITGNVGRDRIEAALEAINQQQPHYKQIHKFYLSPDPFSVENGLLTANRKLKRAAIEARFREQIQKLYQERGLSQDVSKGV